MKIANIVNKISVLHIPDFRTQIELKDTKIQHNEIESVISHLKELKSETVVTGSYMVSYYVKVRKSGSLHYDTTIEKSQFARENLRLVELVKKINDHCYYYYIPVSYFYKPVKFNKV